MFPTYIPSRPRACKNLLMERKISFRLSDGREIETVLIPSESVEEDGAPKRFTLCVSTQVGCALNCKFCATASLKMKRNLSAGEIVEQFPASTTTAFGQTHHKSCIYGHGRTNAELRQCDESRRNLHPRRRTASREHAVSPFQRQEC